MSGLGLGLGPLRSGVRAIDRHFSQTTVQRTLPLKNRRRASERASAAPWPACRPAGTSLGWGERLRRSAVAANISMNMMQYGLWGEGRGGRTV